MGLQGLRHPMLLTRTGCWYRSWHRFKKGLRYFIVPVLLCGTLPQRPGGWADREEVGGPGPPHLCGAGGLPPQRVLQLKGTLLALDKWLHEGKTSLCGGRGRFPWLGWGGLEAGVGRNPPDRQEGRQGSEKIGKAGKFKQEGNISRQAA